MGKALRAVVEVGLTAVGTALGQLLIPIPGVGAAIGASIGATAGGLIANAAFPIRSPKPATSEIAIKSPRPARISGYAIAHVRGSYIPAEELV